MPPRSGVPVAPAPFRPAPLLRGPHRQTLFAFTWMRTPPPAWTPQRLELPDGDFVDLCHFGSGNGTRVCLFHGLEGSVHSHYVGGLVHALVGKGFVVTFMHFRGCSGVPNRLPRAYHSGDTGDIGYLMGTLQRREPQRRLAAIGFSLGGNALLKYLGELGERAPLAAAVAVSVPFQLDVCADRIDRGFSRIYQHYLVARMKRAVWARQQRIGRLPIDAAALARARSFREFDELVTAPLHGFDGAQDYYDRASAYPWLPRVRVPTRLIQALDDPFVGPGPVPGGDAVTAETERDFSRHGGHVGFVARDRLARPMRWLDRRIPAWLDQALGRR